MGIFCVVFVQFNTAFPLYNKIKKERRQMLDISNDLVYIMSESECSSVYALFLLKENRDVQTDSRQCETDTKYVQRNK